MAQVQAPVDPLAEGPPALQRARYDEAIEAAAEARKVPALANAAARGVRARASRAVSPHAHSGRPRGRARRVETSRSRGAHAARSRRAARRARRVALSRRLSRRLLHGGRPDVRARARSRGGRRSDLSRTHLRMVGGLARPPGADGTADRIASRCTSASFAGAKRNWRGTSCPRRRRTGSRRRRAVVEDYERAWGAAIAGWIRARYMGKRRRGVTRRSRSARDARCCCRSGLARSRRTATRVPRSRRFRRSGKT